ncbi:MAG: hypothetical protein HND48_20935 [Chloroflexi bacterium]|nr:hypothetical protein [Chloroflexota bacterium]
MRRWIVVCILLVVVIAPASGQADPFRAWLLHPDRGALTAVDSSGPLGTITLPVPDGFAAVSPDEVAISPDGQTAAYVVYKAGYVEPAVAVLRLSDQQLIANFAPQGMTFTSLGIAPRAAFSPDSQRLALGYMTGDGWGVGGHRRHRLRDCRPHHRPRSSAWPGSAHAGQPAGAGRSSSGAA